MEAEIKGTVIYIWVAFVLRLKILLEYFYQDFLLSLG